MKFGVVVFPGSNCDQDCHYVLRDVMGQEVSYLWHGDTDVNSCECIVLPGGFSYGDYLRTGAIARFSPVMNAVRRFAEEGGPVIGICNGFQILLESGLLPGAMIRNRTLHFICRYVHLEVTRNDTPFTLAYAPGDVLRIPIAHNEGNYYADDETLERLEQNNQIVFRYCGPGGERDDRYNPNGACAGIAGIVNERGNVLGMMPHPERASERALGSEDGRALFASLIQWSRQASHKKR